MSFWIRRTEIRSKQLSLVKILAFTMPVKPLGDLGKAQRLRLECSRRTRMSTRQYKLRKLLCLLLEMPMVKSKDSLISINKASHNQA